MPPPYQIRQILLPIDESVGTHLAVDCAAFVARSTGAALTLVHVDELPRLLVAIVPGASVDSDLAIEQYATRLRLTEYAAQLVAGGVPDVTWRTSTSQTIASALVELAIAGAYDLIVMGTHARTGVSRVLLGSIAEEVLRHAPCPVMTVHMPAEP
jgi:universal stress protein A